MSIYVTDAPALEFEKVKDSITIRLMNAERNREQLKFLAHTEFLDLAVVFMFVKECGGGKENRLVSRIHLERWGMGIQELYDLAVRNSERLQPEFLCRIEEFITDISENREGNGITAVSDRLQIHVLTNRDMRYGAGCLLYEGVLKRVADKMEDDIVILPCSIHETILLPYKETVIDTLEQMVRTVNAEEVSPEEILSDRVYRYRRDADMIEPAGKEETELKRCS